MFTGKYNKAWGAAGGSGIGIGIGKALGILFFPDMDPMRLEALDFLCTIIISFLGAMIAPANKA